MDVLPTRANFPPFPLVYLTLPTPQRKKAGYPTCVSKMGVTDPAVATELGNQLSVIKLLLTAMQWLWLYDYLLTLGDEIKYAWSGKKSWIFALFIANRYNPIVHFVWHHITMFSRHASFCEATKWVPAYHAGTGNVFAHIAVALRVFAITNWNKWIGGLLVIAFSAEVVNTVFCSIWIGLGPLESLPDVNLDPFELCIYRLWTTGFIIYYSLTMFFDVCAFSIIVVTAWRSRKTRYQNVPSILDTIERDATLYFVLIFSAHFVSLLLSFFAPANVQVLPALTNTTFVPLMASRLMLSLKKAAEKPKAMWNLQTMTNNAWGRTTEDGTVRFATRTTRMSHEISLPQLASGGEDVELDVIPPSHSGSREAP